MQADTNNTGWGLQQEISTWILPHGHQLDKVLMPAAVTTRPHLQGAGLQVLPCNDCKASVLRWVHKLVNCTWLSWAPFCWLELGSWAFEEAGAFMLVYV